MAKVNLVRRPTLISPKHLLRYVFFTEMQVDQAAKILNTIVQSDGVVEDTRWQDFVLTSRGLYVKVMRKLRDVGLVEKRMGEYRISKDFSNALEKLAKYWDDIVSSFNRGDREIEF